MKQEPIAIVGITAIHPGSVDSQGFWNDVLAGRDLMADVPSHYWLIEDFYDPNPQASDKTYGRRGAFLSRLAFDALEFGIPPSALPATDTAQLLALIGAKRTLEDAARGRAHHVSRDRVSVILGVAGATSLALHTAGRLQRPAWVKGLRESGMPEEEVQTACDRIAANFTPLQENTFPGLLSNVVAGRIANRFDLGGSNFVVDAACAGSLAAVNVAMNELHLHQADMVLTGGVDAMNDVLMYMCFSKTPALSPTGDCRPFSDKADGTMLGEGLSMFALRRLADAERDGDRIYAVIRGMGSSSDGRAKSVYAPRPKGQAIALRRAYEAAGVDPSTVELVEAHGTGTAAGDAAEFESLRTVYQESQRQDKQWCALGSVKSQIGHAKSAAGAASLFKTVMALHHRVLPPTLKVDRPNPKLDIPASPFYLNSQARPWISNGEHPRRAAVSSFGFGGTNFHAVLEEYAGSVAESHLTVSPEELVVLSAASSRQLAERCHQLAQELARGMDLRRVARNSQQSFDSNSASRLAVIGANASELAQKLEASAAKLQQDAAPSAPGIYFGDRQSQGKVAFLFSGQGSQYPNMGRDLAIHFAPALEAWDLAEQTLQAESPRFHDVVFPLPAFSDEERAVQVQRLTSTENAQLALAAASLAHLALTRALGLQPDFVAGHSFGELPALHCAGVIGAEDLLRMARRRGSLMADSSQAPGAMSAVSHSADQLRALLSQWGSDVAIANQNSPRQTVLSGSVEALNEVEQRLTAAGISFRRLPVSTAFHSPLMNAAVAPFAGFLDTIEMNAAAIPVISNAGATPYPSDPAAIRRQLAEQIVRPVEFARQVEELYDRGVRTFVELGAGSVLTGLVDACLNSREHVALSLDQKQRHGVTALWHAMGQLAASGCALNFASLWSAFAPVPEQAAPRPNGSTFLIDGAPYSRPYPPVGGAASLPKPNARPVSTPTVMEPTPAPVVATNPSEWQPKYEPVDSQPVLAMAPSTLPTSIVSEVQAQITEAQKSSHAAILESLSLTLKSLEALSQAVPVNAAQPAVQAWQTEPVFVPPPAPAPERFEAPVAPAPMPATPALSNLVERLLRIVADKTGYPVEVLNLDADMEAELGIDSIKRVEIFSAVQDQVPGLPELKPESMATLRTLRQIGAFLGQGEAPLPVAAAVPNLVERLLQIVADKTGYPVEVLNLDADMEAELGIDSIKRVEIFSAVQDQVPGLPEIKPESMATLRTLRQIGAFLGQGEAPLPVAAPAPNLVERLLQIVADKTGYPVEVLNLDADMEAELGIDSIKRVEIFSAVQDQVPGLPEIRPESMATLRTLRQIGAFLGQGEAPLPVAAPTTNLVERLLQIVADKTGYPVEVLNLDADMEAELGIDSIKRVEIFSAVQDQVPGLPELKPESMATLRTLRQIGAFLGQGEAPVPVVTPAPNLVERLLQIVADKTGYPVELLNLDADLEAELGIDSIKRVEIFSAVQDQVPGLPELKPESMATLRTLRQIGAFLGQGEAPLPVAAPAPNLVERLLQIVADKTGYPVEVLNLDADMEAELGIDSIKRVEIFSAVQDQVPGLPEMKPESMATLRTLRQIGAFLGQGEAPLPVPTTRCVQQIVRSVEIAAPGLPLPGLYNCSRIAVTPDGRGISDALVPLLASLGLRAEAVSEPTAEHDGLIYLGALQPVASVEQAIAINRAAFHAVQTFAKASSDRKLLVTVQGTGGDFGLESGQSLTAWTSGVSALAKTAAAEWNDSTVKVLDIEIEGQSAETLADSILTELLTGGTQTEVGLQRGGRRVVLEAAPLVPAPATLDASQLGPQPVLVVSGGARGVTASCLVELARTIQPRIALLGRTALLDEPSFCRGVSGEAALKQAFTAHAKAAGLPIQLSRISADVAAILAAREVHATLRSLQEAGAQAIYLPTDLKIPATVEETLREVRAKWGPITGIVHGAGVLADKHIAMKTAEQFDRVFDTKVEGLRALLDATAGDPIQLICLFSSVAGRYGNAGQCDYAMANEVLNKVAAAEARRRGPACIVRSLAWGPWAGGMVTASLAAHFTSHGVELIPLEDGARAFVESLLDRRPGGEIVISAGGFPAGPRTLAADSVDLLVNAHTYPFLNGHRIQSEAVVPVVLVLEWFYRAAATFHPQMAVSACEDLRVLSGVVLTDFDGAGQRLRLSCKVPDGDATALRCELRNPETGRLHYSATLRIGGDRHSAPALNLQQSGESVLIQDHYDSSLFHGPEFQVIRELDSMVEDGARATLTGTREMQWTAGPWKTEAAGLDGALQVLRLWTKEQLGELSLPTRIGRFISYNEPTDEVISCVARCRTVGKLRTVSDITLSGEDGRGLAALQEVEMHVTGEKAARQ